jgi:hypothetical protein
MMQTVAALIAAAVDYERTLFLAIEVSSESWVLAAQVPGLPHTKAKRTINPDAESLMAAIARYRARATATGHSVERVITVYEAGWSGFWLARWIMRRGVEARTLSSLRVCLSIVGCAALSLMALMPSCCFGHCSIGCAVSRACVRWCRPQTRPMKMPDGVFASGPSSSPSASV